MKTQKIIPVVKDYLWGGAKLKDYGIKSDKDIIAEAWTLSLNKNGTCTLTDGTPLTEVVDRKAMGEKAAAFPFFPVLVKLIDAKENLSVQVHPSDSYALKNENSFGKTEMWYIVEADDGAGLYIGLKKRVSADEFRTAAERGTVEDLLNFKPVKAGECYFIPSGTVHAICRGCLILEVQQNSDLTYRVYDYKRVGADGKERELHLDKALEVAALEPYKPTAASGGVLASCEYFTVRRHDSKSLKNIARSDSFTFLQIIGGSLKVDGVAYGKGDGVFIPAGEEVCVEGDGEVIEVFV